MARDNPRMRGRTPRMALVGPEYSAPSAQVALQGQGGVANLVQVGADFEGRVSAAMLGGLILAMAAFYIWTRGFQA